MPTTVGHRRPARNPARDREGPVRAAAQGPALHEIDAAKAVCGQCAVRLLCLSYALQTRQAGIWGGTTWEERSATREPAGWRAFEPA